MFEKNKITKFLLIYFSIYLVLVILIPMAESVDPNSSIKTFADSLWYSIVTIASVGYGDKYPITPIGKLLGALFIFGSIFTLTVLISRVSDFVSEKRERKRMGYEGTKFSRHIVIVGWDNFAKLITDVLIEANRQVAIITENKDSIEHIFSIYGEKKVFALLAPINEVSTFEKANLDKASIILINRQNDTDKLITLLSMKQHFGLTNFMVTLDEANLKETFEAAGVKFVLSKNELASKLIASYIFEPDVANFNTDLISSSTNDKDFDTQQFLVNEKNPYLGKTYGFAFNDLREKFKTLLIGISKKSKDGYQLHKLAEDNIIIEKGDYLIFINNLSSSVGIEKLFKVGQGYQY